MTELSNLFTQTSTVLRDITITELKKNNDFLRNYVLNNDSILCKYKVIVERHVVPMGNGEIFPECSGIIISIKSNQSKAIILYTDEDNKHKLKWFPLSVITVVDERVAELL